jgi:cytochrome c peroxidase
MKWTRCVLVIFLLAISFTAVGQQRGRRGLGPGPDLIDEVRDTLNLSPEQVDKLRGLLESRRQADQAAQNTIQSKIDALAAAQEKSPSNGDAVTAAAQALRQAEQAQQSLNDKFKSDFINLLTPEQKKTFDSINQTAASVDALARLGVIGNGRGRGGGRGFAPPFGPPPNPAPRGRGAIPSPPANPLTAEKVSLGQQLFFDKRLSADGTLSCASCHDPERAFADGLAVAHGIHGTSGMRNSPSLVEAGFNRSFFWDGRASTLEGQVLQPIFNPKELGLTEAELEAKTRLKAEDVSAALASYVRTIRSTNSRYDRFQRGDNSALTELEQAGLQVFRGKGRCAGCHAGPDLTDGQFHNTGVAWQRGRFTDEGRYSVTLNERDHGAFKTPTLREISKTSPYMHDGSIATLEEVVDYYNRGGRRNPQLDRRVRPLNLSSGEKAALVAFLKTLNGDVRSGLAER